RGTLHAQRKKQMSNRATRKRIVMQVFIKAHTLSLEANVPGSRGLILTETRGGSLPTSKYSILGKR
ncbi:hypothetical protein HAX54_000914, partial [Datura stramonium]|nr:hypothetical protein [Datura stramonium]